MVPQPVMVVGFRKDLLTALWVVGKSEIVPLFFPHCFVVRVVSLTGPCRVGIRPPHQEAMSRGGGYFIHTLLPLLRMHEGLRHLLKTRHQMVQLD